MAGPDVAVAFVAAVQAAYRSISLRPATGSPLYADEFDLPGLRTRRPGRFPYLIFYLDRGDHIDVSRVLDAQRDLPESLAPAAG